MKPRRQLFEFGPFRIEAGERLLRRDGTVVAVPPKAIALLMALLQRSGEFVAKEELLTTVWPDTFVEEGSLAQNVSLLRKVLGETARAPYIETIPRRGYRFVAPVRTVGGEREATRALAVLPLANLSGDRSQDFFAEGMTDELISCLMAIRALRVASRTSAVAYRDTGKPLRQIAEELQVEWIVEGSVLYSGSRVRITAHLIEAATDRQLWARTYERDVSEILALQSSVASDIAAEVRVTLTTAERSRIGKTHRVDPEAYDAHLRGRHFWNKRTRDGLKRAADYFRAAIDGDPTYAPAYAGLADTYSLLGTIGYDVLPPGEAMPRARAAALRALEIDDRIAQAHASLGYVKLSYEWDWVGAEDQFKRAIAIDPVCATAHHWYGHCLFAMGRMEDAARQMRRAQELDPLSVPCNLGVGWSFYYQRKFDQAISHYQRTLEIAPNLPMVLYEIGLAYQNTGRYEEALATFERASTLSGGEAAAVMLLGHIYALLGRADEAAAQRRTLEDMSRRQYVPPLYTAFIYAGEGNTDQAFAWFERACDERSNYMIYLAVEPSLDPLRRDARYLDLLQRVGLLADRLRLPPADTAG
jgi:TolB-like protein/tetratricopeptide (TPR) repeat protein